ncbi:uncharacterized protein LOC130014783 [Mercurialis annua]|uniref:uncharacterized protein LOC130014783 n=1 Tax=Mercurialis annua TaxID=3986 RepID=UPI0024AD624C|nr:uncharacterized protein LOC130014783 [Mercurialis annua]
MLSSVWHLSIHHKRSIGSFVRAAYNVENQELNDARIIYSVAPAMDHNQESHPESHLRVPAIVTALQNMNLTSKRSLNYNILSLLLRMTLQVFMPKLMSLALRRCITLIDYFLLLSPAISCVELHVITKIAKFQHMAEESELVGTPSTLPSFFCAGSHSFF